MPQQVTGYGLTLPSSLDEWINCRPAYNASPGNNRLLDQSRLFALVNPNYYYYGYAFPKPEQATIAPLQTFEDTIAVVPNSYLMYITAGFASAEPDIGEPGFDFNIYDKGANVYLGLNDMNFFRNTAGDMQETIPGVSGDPTGPWFLTAPYCVTPPGQLNLQLTNLSNNVEGLFMQVLLAFAVPVNAQSRAAVNIQRSTGAEFEE